MEKKARQKELTPKEYFYRSFGLAMLISGFALVGFTGYLLIDNGVRPMYSTSSYHFNVQYRAGKIQAMNEVINNSLIPLLQMYARHPTWKANIEFQGLMLEHMKWMDDQNLTMTTTLPNGTVTRGIGLLRYLTSRGADPVDIDPIFRCTGIGLPVHRFL
ncbi:MAG: hypothetical protein ACTSWN_02540 [Promethearchaeota archaeon]